jgi:hypothetical protein
MVGKAHEGALVLGAGGSITVRAACKGNLSVWHLSCGRIHVLAAQSLLVHILLGLSLFPARHFFQHYDKL